MVVGRELAAGLFEGTANVQAREKELHAAIATLDQFTVEQRPLFEDALERMNFREQTHLSAKVHADLIRQVQTWGAEQMAYLKVREVVAARVEAELQLNVLEVLFHIGTTNPHPGRVEWGWVVGGSGGVEVCGAVVELWVGGVG